MNTLSTTPAMNKIINYAIIEDDICYDWDDYDVYGAVLYDLNNNKIITTKYGHGADMKERSESISISEAINSGLVTVETVIITMINSLPTNINDIIYDYAPCYSLDNPLGIPVNVVRGRKFKGQGYLIYSIEEPVRYGLGAWHNEKNNYPIILNPVDGTFNKINSFGYIEYDKELINSTKENIIKNIEMSMSMLYTIGHAWAYRMSYSSCDTTNYNNLVKKITKLAIPREVPEIVKTAIDNKKIADKTAREIKMKEELPSIIEWVKNNTDKTSEEDILTLAKHIWNKHNK